MPGFSEMVIVIFYHEGLRMSPEDKKNKESVDDSSPVYALVLVVSMVLGIIFLVLKLFGVF
jgi:hypothetical protein